MVLVRGDDEPLAHGGDLGAARRLFPGAPEPFVDLSTGINPHPYPSPRFSRALVARLPDPAQLDALAAAAARAYGAPSAAHVVPAPGTQILLPLAASLVPQGLAVIPTPSYGEHTRAAAFAAHRVRSVRGIDQCGEATLVIVGNPNNPDGRLLARSDLLALARELRRRGGVLVVDEAFMDVEPSATSLTSTESLDSASLGGDVDCGNVVVLRSFGKFFGLAGLRLGFALAARPLAARLGAALGPWAVSAPALAAGIGALSDAAWIDRTRRRLAAAAKRLDAILAAGRLSVVGGTSLFRLVQTPAASELFQHLGHAGIWVRAFPEHPHWLRFGLPAGREQWRRLERAIASFGPGVGGSL
jgi:cobalamin biosynthesis protein CobC